MDSLEPIEVSAAMCALICRRTNWIARDFIGYQRSLQMALANAYIAGMNDAVDTLYRKQSGLTNHHDHDV